MLMQPSFLFISAADTRCPQRHISEVSHIAMADMLSLFVRKEVCEARRTDIMPKVTFKKQGPWPSGEDLGKVPPLQVFSSVRSFAASTDVAMADLHRLQWRNPAPLDPVKPVCQTMYSKPPLTPTSHTADFQLIEWHGKKAWSSSTPGGQIRFSFHGKQVGIFVWATNGKSNPEETSDDPEVRKREAPGQARCWVEDVHGSKENGMTVTSHWDFKTAPSSECVQVFQCSLAPAHSAILLKVRQHCREASLWRAVRSVRLCPLREPWIDVPLNKQRPGVRDSPDDDFWRAQVPVAGSDESVDANLFRISQLHRPSFALSAPLRVALVRVLVALTSVAHLVAAGLCRRG